MLLWYSRMFKLKFVLGILCMLNVTKAGNRIKTNVKSNYKSLGASTINLNNSIQDRGAQNVYFISRNAVTWGDAWFQCRQAQNGELLSIETLAEDIFIRDLLIKQGIASVWTSGAYDESLTMWRWLSNGNEAKYSNWLQGSQHITQDMRIAFEQSAFAYGWKSIASSSVNHFICEKPSPVRAKDCAELQLKGKRKSGIYTIFPFSKEPDRSIEVLCDLKTNGGGWTVFQRRGSYCALAEDFYRDWISYENGFGSLKAEFWLGLMSLAALTKSEDQALRIEMMDWDGISKDANYASFSISDATDMYRLHVSNYSGSAGDSLTVHDNYSFTTLDKDNDNYTENCAQLFKGGWWYHYCHSSNLNGVYVEGGNHETYAIGINWYSWHGYYYGLKQVDMKIRPRNFV